MDGGLIKGTLLPLLLIGAAAYIGVCALLFLLQDRLIFFPQALPDSVRRMVETLPDTAELEVQATDGTRLRGWLRHQSADPARGLVIYFGGNAEEVSGQILDAPELAPWSVAAFNYRGYGRSEGVPSETALVSDALAIYDLLAARPDIDERRIAVLGRSLGSGVAVPLAAKRPVRGLILVSPFDSLRGIAKKTYPFVPVEALLRHPFDSIALAPRIDVPLLVLAGDRDDLIPALHSRRLSDAWGGVHRFELFPGVGHNDIHAASRYWTAMREFLSELSLAS